MRLLPLIFITAFTRHVAAVDIECPAGWLPYNNDDESESWPSCIMPTRFVNDHRSNSLDGVCDALYDGAHAASVGKLRESRDDNTGLTSLLGSFVSNDGPVILGCQLNTDSITERDGGDASWSWSDGTPADNLAMEASSLWQPGFDTSPNLPLHASISRRTLAVCALATTGTEGLRSVSLVPRVLAANAAATLLCEIDVTVNDGVPPFVRRELGGSSDSVLNAVTAQQATIYGGCAVVRSTLYCWGTQIALEGGWGELVAQHPTPVPVLSGVEALVTKTYTHNCVIMQKARGLRCWGDNEYSQLGVSQWDYPSLTVPPDTDVLTDVYEVATGFGFTCAVKGSSRNLYCWGSNEGGQLGIGSTIESITLEQALSRPPTKSGARLLSCGINTCCVSDMWTGRLFCWGSNSQGLLGLGSDVGTELAPVQLSKLPGRVLSVSVSDSSACAVVQTGGIGVAFCWGSNNNGKLGANLADGTSSVPVRVVLPRRVYAATIAASYLGMCVTTPGGAIYCAGEVGASSFGGKPVQLPVRFQARDVIAGYDHFCSRNQKRHLYCWGSNDNFEAGGSVYDITSKDSVMVNVRFSS